MNMEQPSISSKFNPKLVEEKCTKAGVSFWLISEIALALQDELKPSITEEELDNAILKELQKRDPDSARMFENYHKVYVRTSDGIMESFNKEKIVQSLMKETTLAQNICMEIAGEVESDIRRLELRYVSAPLIREMVNSKLLERRYMQAKTDYTRLGLPIFDVSRMIEYSREMKPPNPTALHKRFGDAIAEEYTLVKILPDNVSKAHLTGMIHLHDLPYFGTRPISLQNDLRWFLQAGLLTNGLGEIRSVTGPAKHPEVVISHAIRVFISGGTHISGGHSFDFFNNFLAPYTINKSDKDVMQIIQTFLYELNQIYAVGGIAQSTLNLELETPGFLKKEKAILPGGMMSEDTYYDYERESIRFLNLFLQTMNQGDYDGKTFKMPKIVLKIRNAIPYSTEKLLDSFVEKNDLTILNLKANPSNMNMISPNQILPSKLGKWYSTLRTGVLQEISINLPRIALLSKDDAEFFNYLDEALDMAKEACKKKKEIIEKRLHKDKILPFLTQIFNAEEYYVLENAPSIINFVGLDNAVREYVGDEINKNSDAFTFADRILAYMNRRLESFNTNEGTYCLLGCLDARNVNARFANMNEKRFGVKEIYPQGGCTHAYSDIEKWLDTEIKLQSYCQGAIKIEVDASQMRDMLKRNALCFTIKARKS